MTDDDRHLPEQAPIDAVLDQGFRFGGMSHQGGIITVPGRMQAWTPGPSAFDWDESEFSQILSQSETIDILVIGTGPDIAVLQLKTEQALREAGLALEISATRAAVRTYNVLLSEDRRVAGAFSTIS